jgi:hypothetical protein
MKLGVTLDPRSGIQEQKLSEDQAHPHPSLEQHQRRQKVVPMIKTDTFDTKIHKKTPYALPKHHRSHSVLIMALKITVCPVER